MRLLIDYKGLAEHRHISIPELLLILDSPRGLEKERAKNPSYFIEQTDSFEEFFRSWRDQQASFHLRLERQIDGMQKEFIHVRNNAGETNLLLGEIIPLLLTLHEKTNTMATAEQLQKLHDDVESIKDVVGKLAVGLTQTETATANLKAKLAEGAADDKAIAETIDALEESAKSGREALATIPEPEAVTVPTGDEHATSSQEPAPEPAS